MPADHDALLLAAADALAAWLHREDRDKQLKPLIGHCRRVAATLREQGWPVEVQCAGLLHDAWESGATFSVPPGYVGTLLDNEHFEEWLILLTRGDEDYRTYIGYLADPLSPPAVRAIKLADLRDNLDPSRGPIPESLRKRYLKAVERLERVE